MAYDVRGDARWANSTFPLPGRARHPCRPESGGTQWSDSPHHERATAAPPPNKIARTTSAVGGARALEAMARAAVELASGDDARPAKTSRQTGRGTRGRGASAARAPALVEEGSEGDGDDDNGDDAS